MRERLLKISLFLVAVFSFSSGALAYAQEDYGLSIAAKRARLPDTIAGVKTPPQFIGRVIQYALSLIGIVFFLLVLYAGFLWMSAMGNAEKAESAKTILESAIIGLVLVLGAWAITDFVLSGLGGGSASNKGEVIDPSANVVGGSVCKGKADGTQCAENGGNICIAGACVLECEKAFPDAKNPKCETLENDLFCKFVPGKNRQPEPNHCVGPKNVQCCRDV